VRIWCCLRALSVSAAAKKRKECGAHHRLATELLRAALRFARVLQKPAVPIILVALLTISLEAQERWKIQFFYDKPDSSLDIRDIQCPSAERCIAAGVIVLKDGRQKGAVVSTNDGGLHWSMADVKENPLSLFFLNASLGWMATERGIWTSDAGEPTWKKLDGLKGILRVYFLDPSHGYAIGSPGAPYETADGGKKWTKLPAANVPSVDLRHTLYECITFRGQHGMAIGEVSPEDADPILDLIPSSIRQGRKSTIVVLETFDGGKSWGSRAVPFFGAITRVSFTKEGSPVFLVEYPTYYSIASSVIQGPLGSGDPMTIFAEKSRVVTDFALLPTGGAVLASIEPPGNSNQIPIPGKLKMLESGDLKTWREMEVDYKAVAQRAVVAAVDARHKWVATDTGMILGLVGGGASNFQRKQKTSLASRVLSTPSPQ
jgi:hypothetical protein